MKKILLGTLFFCLAIMQANSQLNPEQQSIEKVFFDFLKFYQKNEAKFNSFKLYTGTGPDNNPPYKIQWKEVEKYFSYLRASVPYVGEAYIKAERQHFNNSDSSFKAYPDEELPSGFDYDRWAGGQESIDYTIEWHTSKENTYTVIITGNKAKLIIGYGWEGDTENSKLYSVVPFVKEKGKWKMADNLYPADENGD